METKNQKKSRIDMNFGVRDENSYKQIVVNIPLLPVLTFEFGSGYGLFLSYRSNKMFAKSVVSDYSTRISIPFMDIYIEKRKGKPDDRGNR